MKLAEVDSLIFRLDRPVDPEIQHSGQDAQDSGQDAQKIARQMSKNCVPVKSAVSAARNSPRVLENLRRVHLQPSRKKAHRELLR
jgi:hypothetical protein